ncbi:MAG: hypothetical protein KKG47_02825 [Proteobacteria bacterium]|nr:hypothetical protein [Pseudomonadota bacterium]MBU1737918.1 hypothetical protein [Pseudomonadota bacterium]
MEKADDETSLRTSIKAFEKIVEENSGDYDALKMLSTQTILLGTAYTEGRRQKSDLFRQAMVYAEKAMYTNSDFRALINEGKKPWEAIGPLTAREAEAMFFWVTALQYEFKEGMSLPGKIVNLEWLHRALVVLDHLEQVAPEFGNGGVEFAKVICYYALPKFKGGSKSKGDYYMNMAVQKGEKRLLSRWARGKYYYPILGEEEKAREDLEWVARQEIDKFEDLYPWRVHFQEDAQLLLK